MCINTQSICVVTNGETHLNRTLLMFLLTHPIVYPQIDYTPFTVIILSRLRRNYHYHNLNMHDYLKTLISPLYKTVLAMRI
jgi:hypothetical protein